MYRDGVHYVNGTLVGTPAALLRHPEALVYAPEHGHRFNITYAPNRYGLPAFYSLHAWILKYNPGGTGTPPLVANAVTRCRPGPAARCRAV